MEVMDFIHTFIRYCDKQCQSPGGCYDCPFGKNSVCRGNMDIDAMHMDEELVNGLEEWAKKNPLESRQSKLLKVFPSAKLDEAGVLDICPKRINKSIDCNEGCGQNCAKCRYDYWVKEMQ